MYRVEGTKQILVNNEELDIREFDVLSDERHILSGKVEKKVNEPSKFTFMIDHTHPEYSTFALYDTELRVYHNDHILFRGKVMQITETHEHKKTIVCEGLLGYLKDIYISNVTYSGLLHDVMLNIMNTYNRMAAVGNNQGFNTIVIDAIDETMIPYDVAITTTFDKPTSLYDVALQMLSGQGALGSSMGEAVLVEEDGKIYYGARKFHAPDEEILTIEYGKNLLSWKMDTVGKDGFTELHVSGKSESGGVVSAVIRNTEWMDGQGFSYRRMHYIDAPDREDGWTTELLQTYGNAYISRAAEARALVNVQAFDYGLVDGGYFDMRYIPFFHRRTVDGNTEQRATPIITLNYDLMNPSNDRCTFGRTTVKMTDLV